MKRGSAVASVSDSEQPAAPSQNTAFREDRVYVASQWQLMWLRFRKHKLALIGTGIVFLLYATVIFQGFLSPYDIAQRSEFIYTRPQGLHFFDGGRFHLRPFVYGLIPKPDPQTFRRVYVVDESQKYFLRFFVHGYKYKLLGLIPADIHLFGVDEGGALFLLGTDELGRDLFSRILAGAVISLSIGLMGVLSSFVLGAILGGVSGYYGGVVDAIVQRGIEFLITMPSIPLWMALSAAVPKEWSAVQVYFSITLILSLRGWTGLGRVVRGKLLEVREEDFVMAAQLSGSGDWRIITQHLLPSFLSYLIVHMTLAIPGMILGETSLSFLGLGLRPPVVSWGVLLQKAQNVQTVATYPWLLAPAAFVILTVLAFNFMGDGLRDAADPYK
jgi:peptide/nickel transport system permease protein